MLTITTTPGNPSGSTSGVGAFEPVPYRGGMGPGMGTYTGATAEPKTAGGGSGGSGLGTFEPWTTSVDEEIGKWYEPTEETLETVLEENASTISNNALFTFLPDTFNVTVPSSDGCPVWELPAVMGMQSVTVAPLCSDIMNSLWPMVRADVATLNRTHNLKYPEKSVILL
ncbi:hypothetical protein KFZ76_08555 [Methylovulum psychrotolerans]|uniref:hypothetical protein n=1 Tax=Methylovulum psychrotolerans TaxID=1704499 RepID=UPI001BFF5E3A|nr:hypothetical protein [Methylovulum psychrotolerans]MBT9097756.1 hypothetical protein [Methylovulum psychrotolerans]